MPNMLLLHEGEQPTVMSIYHDWQTQRPWKPEMHVSKQFATKLTAEQLQNADTVMCVRGESPLTYLWLRYAKTMGKFLIYFLDDDLKDLPASSLRYLRRNKWLLKCISLCDVLLTPNQLIADEYRDFLESRRAVVSHTAVGEEAISRSYQDSDTVKLVYAASEGHIPNFNAFIKPILPQLFQKFGKQLELHLVGLHPEVDVGAFNSQIFYTPSMTLAAYNDFMKTHHFDIGLAPLVTNHFTQRKYFNKYIEYSKVGICGVYSRVMPFQLVVKDGWNGYYADNTPESWLETLTKAIENRAERERIIDTAQEHLRTCHSEEGIFSALMNEIPELLQTTDKSAVCSVSKTLLFFYKLRHGIFRIAESIYLTGCSLSNLGLQTTIAKIKRKLGR